MRLFRLGIEIAVTLARENDQLGIRDTLSEKLRAGPVRHVADHEMIVITDKY